MTKILLDFQICTSVLLSKTSGLNFQFATIIPSFITSHVVLITKKENKQRNKKSFFSYMIT